MLFSTQDLVYQPLSNNNHAFIKTKTIKYNYLLPTELEQLPGMIEHHSIIEFVSHGAWSSHQLLEKILQKTGPADVIITTWAMTEKPLRTLHRLKNEGKVIRLGGLFERKISSHNPKAYGFAKEVFDKIELSKCHAKVTLIENKDWSISINCSANYTINRRTETGVIICSKESVDFHKKWIFQNEKRN